MFPTSSSGAITNISGAWYTALLNLMIPAFICILAYLAAVNQPTLPNWLKRLWLLAVLCIAIFLFVVLIRSPKMI